MKFKSFIGIDVSKSTLDVYLKTNQCHAIFENNEQGHLELVEWVMENSGLVLAKELLFGFESTGIYSSELALFLEKYSLPFYIISGLELKRSLGIRRGKSDKADSKDIAEYLYEKQEKLVPTVLPSQTIQDLKKLFNYREGLVKDRAAYITRIKEYETVVSKNKLKVYQKSHTTVIACLDKQIETVEREIDRLLHKEELLLNQYNLINSVKGIGPQTAVALIVLTEGFTLFNSWRKFASYAGTAPFPNQSGTFRGTTRTSKLANKRIKTLLTLCAGTAIQYSPEMKIYYQKRVSEGKSKMSTLNVIRNKLLSRAFAVVNRNTNYVDIVKYIN
ncbi:IS110 family transposase [Echinicola sp. CAU 1574]|uniref:IS110 family transposase n=1 Tax=Echinicola arenosa TaxID=2774144 RepID=A0ABR9AEF0_9BACT|nr:IS110 family transposase [Echinicola arenosa]MBD8487122.1 IS110 family transposase [Echinicola arenosa]